MTFTTLDKELRIPYILTLGKPVNILLSCTHSSSVLQALLQILMEDSVLSCSEKVGPRNCFVDICVYRFDEMKNMGM